MQFKTGNKDENMFLSNWTWMYEERNAETLRQEPCFMAFGPNRGAEVYDKAEHLFSQ